MIGQTGIIITNYYTAPAHLGHLTWWFLLETESISL